MIEDGEATHHLRLHPRDERHFRLDHAGREVFVCVDAAGEDEVSVEIDGIVARLGTSGQGGRIAFLPMARATCWPSPIRTARRARRTARRRGSPA
ncbi:Carbamoyl-phosphate synthase L chain, ATP-binding protein [Acidiphilium sp. PM]|nr:Carbamoyl-phosphate synthase L chain, ATP-binding protein [Acidiphilium sp. PM]